MSDNLFKRPLKQGCNISTKSKFLGVQIPSDCDSFLNLYCLANGFSKSNIIRSVIRNWKESVGYTEQSLVDKISIKTQDEWTRKKVNIKTPSSENIEKAFLFFKADIQVQLKKRGMPQRHINKIAKNLVK